MAWTWLALAVVIAAVALHLSRQADTADRAAERLLARHEETEADQSRALRRASREVTSAYDVDRLVSTLLDANIESSRALGRLTSALNQAVDAANAGDLSGLRRIAEVDGGAALDDLRVLIEDQDGLLQEVGRALDRATGRGDREAGA